VLTELDKVFVSEKFNLLNSYYNRLMF